MKRLFSLTTLLKLFLITSISAGNPVNTIKEGDNKVTIVYLTNETFKQLVFNYEKNKEWKYEGTKPAIIDFYASWCPPCRQLSPLVEEIAKEYSGKIVVYKVDTDKEKILSSASWNFRIANFAIYSGKRKTTGFNGIYSKRNNC